MAKVSKGGVQISEVRGRGEDGKERRPTMKRERHGDVTERQACKNEI